MAIKLYRSSTRNALRDAPFAVHAIALGTFCALTLLLLALFLYYRDTDVWLQWAGRPLKLKHAFNEAVRGSIFRQRANTWSNLGFVFVGIYVLAYAGWDAHRETSNRDPYAVGHPALMGFFGVACIILGIGSGLMHGAMTPWGHKADVFGMFITMTALIALQWGRRMPALVIANRSLPTWPLLAGTAMTASAILTTHPKSFGGGATIMAALIGLVGLGTSADVLLRNPSQQFRWLAIAIVSLALAYYLWNLDRAGRFTGPDSWLQGHAYWHLLTSVSLACMAIFYRSETPRSNRHAVD
jgi:hypothetical protein